jgi:phage terminase small subunit
MKLNKPNQTPPPDTLSQRAATFWREINERYVLEPHDLERLRACCEAIDVIDASEAAIRSDGRFVNDRYGTPKAHPAINVARDARQLLLRAIRELNIDVELPQEQRIPRQGRRYA